jgi:hypothetical protein
MTIRSKILPPILAAAMLAGTSFAFAADNDLTPGDHSINKEDTTGSINTEGRTPTPEERERCMGAAADDAFCNSLNLPE